MKRNNLRILSIISGIILILIIIGSIMHIEMLSSSFAIIVKTMVIQSFLFFCGLYISRLALKELIPQINIAFILRIIGTYVKINRYIVYKIEEK